MNNLKYHISKAKGYIKKGNLNEAHNLLCQVLKYDPQNKYVSKTINKIESNKFFLKQNTSFNLDELINKIIQYYTNGQLEEATVNLENAYRRFPNSAMINNLKGLILKKQNKLLEAENFFKKAYQIDTNLYESLNNLGNLYYQSNQWDKAIEAYTKLINNHPNYIHGLSNRSNTYLEKNMPEKALQDINLAIEKNPNDPLFWYNKSNIHKKLNDNNLSINCLNKALQLNPKFVKALNNKSSILEEMGKLDEAIKLSDECLNLDFSNATYHYNKGAILSRLGKFTLAEDSLKKAIELKPDHFEAKWNLSNCQLLLGNFKEGFENFEARRKLNFWEDRHFNIPELENLNQVKGNKILITTEQGLGDTIQFTRFAKKLSLLGGNIYLEVPNPLKGLFKEDKQFKIISKSSKIFEFDFHIPLMSTLKLFNFEDIKNTEVTEISFNTEKEIKWKNVFKKNKFNVGVAWQGNPSHHDDKRGLRFSRSFSLKNFSFLRDFENINLFNLQKNFGHEQISELGFSDFLIDFGKDFDNGNSAFCDSISVMRNLDLVITCDTSIAHLAGSLGTPVWNLLKFVPDWRWSLNNSYTHWYPSMRLYRQNELGNWTNVFSEIKDDLELKLKSRFYDVA